MKQSKKSKHNEDFEPIQDMPENVAKAILSAPPKKHNEWRYMRDSKKDG